MIYGLIAVVVVGILFFMTSYNGLVMGKNKVKNAWGQIDVQLKRRFDLIPNIVETVKGYATHERTTLEEVTAARTKFMSAATPEERMDANAAMTPILGRLMAVAEAYPDLKASTGFVNLQSQLADTENKIGFTRQFYNDVVMDFNNKVQMFPTNIVAGMFNFKVEPFFEANDVESAAPVVKF